MYIFMKSKIFTLFTKVGLTNFWLLPRIAVSAIDII